MSRNSGADNETITAALELVAERGGDITPRVFDAYFERCADSRELMSHMDEYMLGRMMDQVLLLVMEPGEEELESYLKFETANHRGYGVLQHMYENLFASLLNVVRDTLGVDYDTKVANAFDRRCGYLLERIEAASA